MICTVMSTALSVIIFTLSVFSFKYYTRDWARCVPKKIGIKGEYCEDPYVHENPYSQVLAQGTCGENVSWTLKYGGHLTISGEGDMEITGYDSPWEDLVFSKVTIEDGVTSISDCAFNYCRSLAFASISARRARFACSFSRRSASFRSCSSRWEILRSIIQKPKPVMAEGMPAAIIIVTNNVPSNGRHLHIKRSSRSRSLRIKLLN